MRAPTDRRPTRTFGHLDDFLRRLWLECCGHLSAFRLPAGEPARGAKLANLLRPGLKFRYEYDFGSTTELSLRVLGERAGPDGKEKIRLLARNQPPAIPCGQCDGSAGSVCGECGCEPGGRLCKKCAGTHECDEEMLLPVVNSPRAGVCGYTGG